MGSQNAVDDGRRSSQLRCDLADRILEILEAVKGLAVEYYQPTGRPLGVTGEVAEFVAAQTLGLELAPPRTAGYNALRGKERIQIRGRAHGEKTLASQKMGRINTEDPCDMVLLVVLDNATLEPREMWEATIGSVAECLAQPGAARARGVLSIPELTQIARKVWPARSGRS